VTAAAATCLQHLCQHLPHQHIYAAVLSQSSSQQHTEFAGCVCRPAPSTPSPTDMLTAGRTGTHSHCVPQKKQQIRLPSPQMRTFSGYRCARQQQTHLLHACISARGRRLLSASLHGCEHSLTAAAEQLRHQHRRSPTFGCVTNCDCRRSSVLSARQPRRPCSSCQ
jgi:hypothetical protein